MEREGKMERGDREKGVKTESLYIPRHFRITRSSADRLASIHKKRISLPYTTKLSVPFLQPIPSEIY